MTVAVLPTSEPMRPSLELWVFWNTKLKRASTDPAINNPPKRDKGVLTHTLRVAGMLEKISPKPPKAVMNEQIVVGLNGEMPGMPEWS